MTEFFDSTSPTGVIGACWYIKPDRFLTLSDRFTKQSIGSGFVKRCYVSMKESSFKQDNKAASAENWLVGEGHFLDISAYALACDSLPDDLPLYLVFNDTLFTKHPWRLISKRLAGIRDSIASFPAPAASAEVHPTTDLLIIDSHNPARHHLSTFCLLLNNGGFKIFQRLLNELPSSSSSEVVKDWIDTRLVVYPSLSALLHVHLYGPRTPWSWKQNAPALLQRKAVTVIFEYELTVKLLAAGIGVPFNRDLGYRLFSRLGRYG
jgi:hypothetical protein